VPGDPDAPWFRADPRSFVVHGAAEDVVSLWLRRPSSGPVSGRLSVKLPDGVTSTLESTTLLADEAHPLARCDVTLRHPAEFPRGEHEYKFQLACNGSGPLVATTRLSRPFAWEVLAPMSISAGRDTARRVGESQHVIPYTPAV
jgi:hypothetical protein